MIGIYQITNKINGKRYIGKSKHLTNRWHFEIIKECKLDELNICENYYIQLLNNDDYNIIGKQKIKPIKVVDSSVIEVYQGMPMIDLNLLQLICEKV